MNIFKLAKKGLCVLLTAVMAVSFASCGKDSSKDTQVLKNLYKAEDITLPEDINYVVKTAVVKDLFYIYGTSNKTTGEGENMTYTNTGSLYILDSTGKLTNTVKLIESTSDSSGMGTSKDISNVDFDSEGNMWGFLNENTYTETESKSVTYLKKYDSSGKELFSKDLSELTKGDDNIYFNKFVLGSDNNIYIATDSSIWVLDSQGNLLFKTEKSDAENCYIYNVVRSGDGKMYAMIQEYGGEKSKTSLKQIDPAVKGYGTVYDISKNNFNNIYNGSSEYDVYVDKNGSLFGYDFETGKETEIINWTTCGINSDYTQNIDILSDGRIVASGYDYTSLNSRTVLSVMRKLDESEVKDKKVLTLYCWGLDWSLKSKLVEFNKTSDKYIVSVTDYSQYNDYSSDDESAYTAGATKLNNDLIAGKIPDILMLDGSVLSVKNYAAKGLLADLDSLLEKDPDLKREDFVENVLKHSEVDGKLYSIMPYFNIMTMYGKKSNVGDEPGWTFDELYDALDKLPDGAKVMNNMTKKNTLQWFTYMNMDSFVNWETGECKFNSDDFINILEFANKFETEINYDKVDWQEQQLDMSKDRCLIESAYIGNYKSVSELEAMAGGEITYIGFPNSNGTNGACIMGNSELAISSKSKNKDAAWEVIKYLLPKVEPEGTDSDKNPFSESDYYGFPIIKACLEQKAKKAMEPQYYTDENGKQQIVENSYSVNGIEIKQKPCTQADIDKINSLIDNAAIVVRYDQSIDKIIEEESAAFFSGQKTAKEAADMIQNRVNIYINESK